MLIRLHRCTGWSEPLLFVAAYATKSGFLESRPKGPRTVLMKDCPYKCPDKSFKEIFFHGKDSRFNPRIIHKKVFLIGQVPIKIYGLKTVFAIQYIGNRKFFGSAFPS